MENPKKLSDSVEKVTLSGNELLIGLDGREIKIPLSAISEFIGVQGPSGMGGVVPDVDFVPGQGSPTSPAIYFAGPGTYAGFGGIELEAPLNVISWNGSSSVVKAVPIEVPEPENKIPDWDPNADYNKDDQVNHNQVLYKALANNPETEPGSVGDKNWKPISLPIINKKKIEYTISGGSIDSVTGNIVSPSVSTRSHTKIALNSSKGYIHNKFSVAGNTEFPCWNKEGLYIGVKTLPDIFLSKNFPEIGTIGMNLTSPNIDWSGFEISQFEEDISKYVKDVSSESSEPLTSLPKENKIIATVTSADRLPGIYAENGSIINAQDAGYFRSPPLPIKGDWYRVEGLLYLFNIILFNEAGVFVRYDRSLPDGTAEGLLPFTKGYLSFSLQHPQYQNSETYSVSVFTKQKDVVTFVNNAISTALTAPERFDTEGMNVIYADDWLDTPEDADKINKSIQLLAMSGQGGVVILKDRTYLINSSIIIDSNIILLMDNAKIKLKDGVFDNFIRTKSIVPDPANPYGLCLELGVTENFKILGINRSSIEGAEVPYTAANPKTGVVEKWVGDYYGWRTIGILIANGKNYEIAGFKMSKTHCWAISQEWGCEGMYIHDIEFDTNVKNGDGIDFRNGCRNGRVQNIKGRTSDDTVAMTALDSTFDWYSPTAKYIYPLQTMGFDYSEDNGIENIKVDNVHTIGEHHCVIMLSTSAKVTGISLSNISDLNANSGKSAVVRAYTGYGSGYVAGNISKLSINNITSHNARNYAVNIDTAVHHARINAVTKLRRGEAYRQHDDCVDVVATNIEND